MTGPLEDLRIAAFTHFLFGPACAQYLADMGARVTSVEDPRGGAWERRWAGGGTFVHGVSAFHALTHRNTRSLGLNLKTADGRSIAFKLLETADVLIENFRPGVMERLGLGYDDVHALNPRLIYASGTGYGTHGPSKDLPGQDLLIQAASGLASITGTAGQLPTPAGAAVVDQHAAALLAIGILTALHGRSKTGQGDHVEVAMLSAAIDLQQEPLVYYMNGGSVSRPTANLGSGFHEAPYGIYETTTGYVAISLSPMAAVSRALGHPAALDPYLDQSVAFERRDEIYAALSDLLGQRSTEELLPELRAHGVWCAQVNDYASLMKDPTVAYLAPFITVAHPTAGELKLVGSPLRFGSYMEPGPTAPPALGEQTNQILGELGYSSFEIERLRAQNII
jgi:crotonobetainyl-CoA:carnitine CoA-transferase CaiB-like acyl-CoA transferase